MVRVANQLNSRWQRHRFRTDDQPDPVRVGQYEIRPFQGRARLTGLPWALPTAIQFNRFAVRKAYRPTPRLTFCACHLALRSQCFANSNLAIAAPRQDRQQVGGFEPAPRRPIHIKKRPLALSGLFVCAVFCIVRVWK